MGQPIYRYTSHGTLDSAVLTLLLHYSLICILILTLFRLPIEIEYESKGEAMGICMLVDTEEGWRHQEGNRKMRAMAMQLPSTPYLSQDAVRPLLYAQAQLFSTTQDRER